MSSGMPNGYRDIARLECEAAKGPRLGSSTDDAESALKAPDRSWTQIKSESERIAARYPATHQLGDGAHYLIDYWDGLTRFLDHPELPPDNNSSENALRINALIRKNRLFVGSLPAAHRDAIALTVLHSCRLQKLVPADYLARVTPTLILHRNGWKQDLAAMKAAQRTAAVN
jgi:Transposase IS66 family